MRSSDIACTPPRLVGPAPTGPRPAPTRLAKLPPLHSAPSRQRWDSLSPAARRILAVTALSFGLQAHALQVVEASDGVAVEAIASLKEPTRIRIEGTPITDVFGNIYSSHCGGSPLPAAAASPGVPSTTPGPATPARITSPSRNKASATPWMRAAKLDCTTASAS